MLYRKIFLNNVALIVQYAAASLVPFLLIPHIIRQIGLVEFGALAVALAWSAYGALVVQYAFHLSGPQYMAELSQERTQIGVFSSIASAKLLLLVSVLIASVMAYVIVSFFGVTLTFAQTILIIAVPLGTALHCGWYLQSVGRFASASVVSILGSLVGLVIGLSTVNGSSRDAEMAAVSLAVGPLIGGFGTAFLAIRNLWRREGARFKWSSPTWVLKDGWPLFVSQFTSALYSASGPIVIAIFSSTEQVGAYSAIERLANALIAACLLTHTAAYPKLAQLYVVDRTTYRRVLVLVVVIYLALVSLLIGLAISQWNPLIEFIFGENRDDYSSIILAAFFWMLLGIFGSVLTGYWTVSGRRHLVFPLTLKVLIFSFFIGLPGVFIWGAWAWLASLCISQSLVLLASWKAIREEMDIFHKENQ